MKKFSLLCAAAAFAAPAAIHAQAITSEIEGQVTGSAGAPVPNARVTITDARTGAARTIATDAHGRFVARGLIVGGPYSVTATAAGLQGQTVENINTSLQGATSLTFNLEPAATTAAEETIVVTGARANVTQLAVGPGNAFGTEALQNIPSFNRDVRDVVRIDPRVSLDRDDTGSGQDRISCLGGNDRGNSFTIDGIPQGDIYGLNDTGFASRSSTPIPYDAVRETQVQFSPFDVEYSGFTGCAINVVTRSGSNRITGSAFYEYSNNDLRGDRVEDATVAPVQPEKRWGVALGGPIIRDRLFIFGAYEHSEAGQSQDDGPAGADFPNPQAGVPVAAFNEISQVLREVYGIDTGPLVTNRPFKNDRYFVRGDLQITDDQRFEATYQRLEESTLRSDDFFTGNSPQATGENSFYLSGTKSNYYSARLYSNWTDKLSTEIRGSYSDIQDLQDPFGGGEAQSDSPIPRFIVGIQNASGTPNGTVLAGPGTSRSANDLKTKLYQFRALANYDAGDHQIKFGVEANHADLFNLFVQNATGTFVFQNVNDLRQGLLSRGLGNNQTSTTPNNVVNGQTEGFFINTTASGGINEAAAAFKRTIYSAYVQDQWRMNDQLELTLGVRADWYDGGRPSYNGNFAARYGFRNNYSFSSLDPLFLPRIAATYDVNDFSIFTRTKVRGGVGIFSGGDPLVWFGNAFQNNGFGFGQGTTQATGCPTGQIDVVVNGQFTGAPACAIAAGSTQAARGLGDTQSISPNIKAPTVLRANFGIQTDFNFGENGFFSGWRLNADYIYSRYRNPITIVDLAQTPAVIPSQALGLNGFTIDGRPIYRSIDPSVAGCTARLVDLDPAPVYQNVNLACFNTSRDDELQLSNAGSYRSHVASIFLSKDFDRGVLTPGGGVFISLGYAYTDAQDRRNLFNSTAGSNYDLTAAFDRQNPDASRGFYESRHNITARMTFTEQFINDLDTRFGFTFVGRSGRPFSLTFAGGGVFNDDVSGSDNALVYVPAAGTAAGDSNISPLSNPAAVQQLFDLTQSLNCARSFAGRTIDRNTCTNDWYFDIDLAFSQELPGPGRFFGRNDTIKLYATVDNFLNLLDRDWNVQHRRNFSGLQDIAALASVTQNGVLMNGVDNQGRYIIGPFNGASFDADNQINISSSVWRIKVGVSYNF
jgi:hypothetical protein